MRTIGVRRALPGLAVAALVVAGCVGVRTAAGRHSNSRTPSPPCPESAA